MEGRQEEVFTQVKARFLAACRVILLGRLTEVQDQHPEVDTDLLVELVILSGIGYLSQMQRVEGQKSVTDFLNQLLQELTIVVCDSDDELLKDIHRTVAAMIEKPLKEAVASEDEGHVVKVQSSEPLPGVGWFGMRFPGGGN
jgi:hypothetical protein